MSQPDRTPSAASSPDVDRLCIVAAVGALHKMKARVGRERRRAERIYNEKLERTGVHDERAFGEANVLGIVQGFIDEEVAKIRERI